MRALPAVATPAGPDGSGSGRKAPSCAADECVKPASAWQNPLPRDPIAPASSQPPAGPHGGGTKSSATPRTSSSGCSSSKPASPKGSPKSGRAPPKQQQQPPQQPPQASTLESLPPDVMHRVLLGGSCRDAASLKLASRRLCSTVRATSIYWAPMVEARMVASPHLDHLWARLAAGGSSSGGKGGGGGGAGADSRWVGDSGDSGWVGLREIGAAGTHARRTLRITDLRSQITQPPARSTLPRNPRSAAAAAPIDWLQVWCCLERATQGPWAMDVTRLSRRAAPHGVLLIFEVLLHHVPPSADPAAAAPSQLPAIAAAAAAAAGSAPAAPCAPGRGPAVPVVVQQHAWKDNVSVLSFSLDGRRVEVVVDTGGR
jgi:hypothetical protein